MCTVVVLGACGDDDKRDDSELEMSYLTGKDWYYNGWLGNKYEYVQNDLLQVMRLERDNTWKTIDYSGRRVMESGYWEQRGNSIVLKQGEKEDVWNVLRSGNDYLDVNLNAVGKRSYTTKVDFLKDLTADAFYRNEWKEGRYTTRIGVEVQGNANIREAAMITGPDEYRALEYKGFHWNEGEPGMTGQTDVSEDRRVRFYIKIAGSQELKLEDVVEAGNMVKRSPEEVGLTVSSPEKRKLKVQWNPYGDSGIGGGREVYYQVEILPGNLDENNAWFVSQILPAGTGELVISESTGGSVNKLKEKKDGEHYVVRLVAIVFERHTDVYDAYSYANVQAKTYFTTLKTVWE